MMEEVNIEHPPMCAMLPEKLNWVVQLSGSVKSSLYQSKQSAFDVKVPH